MKLLKYLVFILFLSIISCQKNTIQTNGLETIYQNIKSEFAPDKRVELFNIQFIIAKDILHINGETTTQKGLQILVDSIQQKGINFISNVRVLPDTAVGDFKYAVARNSVINIRSEPSHSAELGTQGLLGMPLKVFDKNGDFYRVQTPDRYISWVDKGGITLLNENDFKTWQEAKKVIFTQNFGYVYADENENQIISDISLGGILKFIAENKDFYQVEFPDKRTGFLKKSESALFENWQKNTTVTAENIERVAKTMDGFPYLWGGTSAKGIDCSGFTKMVYLMNGFIIPRDASQQINAGKIVDENLDFSDLQKGDLLFFGKKATSTDKQKVTHVGIWLGNENMEFIHASGNVHISSMDKNHPLFDEFNKNRYLGARRYLGVDDEQVVKFQDF